MGWVCSTAFCIDPLQSVRHWKTQPAYFWYYVDSFKLCQVAPLSLLPVASLIHVCLDCEFVRICKKRCENTDVSSSTPLIRSFPLSSAQHPLIWEDNQCLVLHIHKGMFPEASKGISLGRNLHVRADSFAVVGSSSPPPVTCWLWFPKSHCVYPSVSGLCPM